MSKCGVRLLSRPNLREILDARKCLVVKVGGVAALGGGMMRKAHWKEQPCIHPGLANPDVGATVKSLLLRYPGMVHCVQTSSEMWKGGAPSSRSANPGTPDRFLSAWAVSNGVSPGWLAFSSALRSSLHLHITVVRSRSSTPRSGSAKPQEYTEREVPCCRCGRRALIPTEIYHGRALADLQAG